jgi:arsenate reductase
MEPKKKVLFLCTGNSCRSQMAEGFVRALRPDLDAYSAGVEKHGLNPLAVTAMAEAGVDIAGQRSKTVDELPTQEFDMIVTLCGHANENCPYFPGRARRLHVGFDDPPSLARDARSDEEALGSYRSVRDAIKDFVASLRIE